MTIVCSSENNELSQTSRSTATQKSIRNLNAFSEHDKMFINIVSCTVVVVITSTAVVQVEQCLYHNINLVSVNYREIFLHAKLTEVINMFYNRTNMR